MLSFFLLLLLNKILITIREIKNTTHFSGVLPNIRKNDERALKIKNKMKANAQTKELQIAITLSVAKICNTFVFLLTHVEIKNRLL